MIEEILKVLKDNISNSLMNYRSYMTPKSFLLDRISGARASIDKTKCEKEIRDIVGFDKYFEFLPGSGAFIWEDLGTYRNILEFKSVIHDDKTSLNILNLNIHLNSTTGKLKKFNSYHEALDLDGYILNTDDPKSIRYEFRFLKSDNIDFISQEYDTIFFYKEKNVFPHFSHPGYKFPWVVIPNHLINI